MDNVSVFASTQKFSFGVLAFLICLLSVSCSSVFYYPDSTLRYPPKDFALAKEDIHFKAEDGTRLLGWFFASPAKEVKGTIVQFHGNAENMSSHYISLAWLIQHGYNLFSFDYRGYGKSEGEPSQEGTHLDGVAALQKAHQLHRAQANGRSKGQFIVIGQSLGGAIALRALAPFQKNQKVDLVVIDSGFSSYQDVARKKLASIWWTWVFSPLATLLISDSYAPEPYLAENKVRLLVIHDKKDPAVPFEAGQKIFELATSEKQFWILNQGGHVQTFAKKNKVYRDAFLSLLKELTTTTSATPSIPYKRTKYGLNSL